MTKEQVLSRIDLVEKQRESRKSRVKETLRMLANDFGSTSQSDGSVVNLLAPNFIMSTRRRLIAQLYPSNPTFNCTPRVRGFEGRAKVISSLLDYYWRELNVLDVMRRLIDDTLIYGYGVVKIGMGSFITGNKTTETEEEAMIRISEEHEAFLSGESVKVDINDTHELDLEAHMQILNNPSLLEHPDGSTILFNMNEHVEEHQEYLEDPTPDFPTEVGLGPSYDWPFMESVGPDVYWDPMVINPQDSSYIVHHVKKRLLDIKDDPLYKNTQNLNADSYNEEEFESSGIQEEDNTYIPDELAVVTLYEIWDAKTKKVSTYAKGQEEPIRSPSGDVWPDHIQGFPFEWLVFTEVSGETHGPGILEYIKWPQKFLMRLYSELATHSDRSSVKFEIDENRLSPRETHSSVESKLAEPTSHVGIFTTDGPAINTIIPPPIDQSKLMLIQLLQGVIFENSIVSSNVGGVSTSETATQASILASASNINVGDMVERLNRMQSKVANKLLGIVREYGPEKQVFYIVTPNGQEWLNYNINDVQASWQVEVDMPSPFESQTAKQEWLNMFHVFSPIMDPVGRQNFMLEGMKRFGIKNTELYVDTPSVETQSNIHSENSLLNLGQAVQARQGEEHVEHIEGHSMAIQEWSKLVMQIMEQMVQANPELQNNPDEEMVMGLVMQDENARKAVTATQLAQKHIEEHQQLMQNEGLEGDPTRRRQAVPFPTGNVGRTESIMTNQQQGT
tara:strand:- start:1449 stop:3647 length:2199 start_codon:yes stop_codon:yes gene_type:complete